MNSMSSPAILHESLLGSAEDVILCRNSARAISGAAGFPFSDQIRIATATYELARNAFKHCAGARIGFALGDSSDGLILTLFADDCEKRDSRLDDQVLLRIQQLMDEVNSHPESSSVVVEMVKRPRSEVALAAYRRLDANQVKEAVGNISVSGMLDELGSQNEEIIAILEETQAREQEVQQRSEQLHALSEELSETNRGVLALYDELDSLYRLGSVMASQIELSALIQALIDATTELTGAQLGVFFYSSARDGELRCHAVSGPAQLEVTAWESQPITCRQVFGTDVMPAEVMRIDSMGDTERELLIYPYQFQSYLAVPVFDASGAAQGAMIFADKNSKRFGDRHERILTAVATQATVALEKAALYTSVQKANFAKDSFLATLSHELRTPLNPVFVILAELESDQSNSVELRQDLAIIRRNLDLEARLIDDLLDMTKIVQGKVTLSFNLLDMNQLLPAVRQICMSNILDKEISFEMKLDAGAHHTLGDPTRLQQVFWNLLHNAIKFTPRHGKIKILTSVLEQENMLLVEIIDSGKGIDPALLSQIFRPFEQGSVTGMAHFGGLGLGLAISKSVVEAHGGEISAHSTGEGQGASFKVKLKLAEAPPQLSDNTQSPSPSHAKVKPSGPLRILLVDDHVDTLSTLARLLERRKHVVTIAKNADEAVKLAGDHSFDVVVSDIGLPGRNGLELMKELRDRFHLKGIALSGYGTETDISRSTEHGFFTHLIKPLNFDELDAALQLVSSEGLPL